MARSRANLAETLAVPADEDQEPADEDQEPADVAAVEEPAPATPAKKAAAKNAKKAASSPRKKRVGKTTKKTTKAPQKRTQTAPAARETTRPTGTTPTVRVPPTTAEGARVPLVLHQDDARDLKMARIEYGVDANALMRAMIAAWREVPQYHKLVNKLARTAPRGGQL